MMIADSDVLVNESSKMLNSIEQCLNFELNGWPPGLIFGQPIALPIGEPMASHFFISKRATLKKTCQSEGVG
jgi:hypothetical protein